MEVVEPAEVAPPVFEFPSLRGAAIRPRAWIGSAVAHAAVIAVLLAIPRQMLVTGTVARQGSRITLVAPPLDRSLPAGREFSLDNLAPRPPLRVPTAIPPLARERAPHAAPPRPVLLPQPPSVETARVQPGPPVLNSTPLPAPPPPPQIQPEEKPKLAFETPAPPPAKPKGMGLGKPGITPPSSSVDAAMHAAIREGARGVSVGDVDLTPSPGVGGGIFQPPPPPGRPRTRVEMTSDPMGVDFKPYLIQILATIKRNWLAVYPESARLGLAGRVQIQFAIDRDGSIPKLVISLPSGFDALDRAAVAGISASNPLPPLPSDFKGAQVRLQFTFTYNLK